MDTLRRTGSFSKTLLALLTTAALGACTAPGADVGAAGVKAGPQRIVSLSGTLTEIVVELGFGTSIVGVDVTSTFPEPINTLPKVGHGRSVRAEGVLSLGPDLVLGGDEQLDAVTRGQLADAGVELLLFPHELSVEGTRTLIRQVADVFGAQERAEEVIAAIDADMLAVEPIADPPKVLFIYARGTGAPMVAGEGTAMHAMIGLAGGRNAVEGFKEFKPLTPEALIAADPDAVLLFESGMEALQGPEGLLKVPGMAATKAGRNGAFITMDGGLLAGFGPRMGQAAAQLNAAFRALRQTP